MANIKILVRGKNNPSPLYLRFTNGRAMDIFVKTEVVVNPVFWDNKASRYKNVKGINNKDTWNAKFDKLRLTILEKYNESYMLGEIIDKEWIKSKIVEHWERPLNEKKNKIEPHFVYYYEFSDWWLKNEASKWKTGKNKYLDERAIKQYRSFLRIWNKFSGPKKYKIKDVDNDLISDFISFTQDKEGYSAITIKRWVGRIKFFLNRAITHDIKTASNFTDKVYVGQEEDEITKPYLNEDEINRIFNLDFSKNAEMDACRDYLVISCYTALRVSDFMHNLNTSNIKEGYIEIKTKKTGAFVKVPIHPKVKYILEKRFGNLPEKVLETVYNKKIKNICKLAGINEMMLGKIYDKNVKRGVIDRYPKYKLITSHIGRRSMASLLAGKLPKELIAAIGGWKDHAMVDFYNKTSKKDYADMLAAYWKDNEINS